jgi:Uri superfamily endonuclease
MQQCGDLDASIKSRLPAQGGSYILVLQSDSDETVGIGRLGDMTLRPGFYLYVGSAFGPGGLRARVGRHAQRRKPLRWHIDYLRAQVQLRAVVFSIDAQRYEEGWSRQIQGWADTNIPMPGFGASDSRAASHLFFLAERPSGTRFEVLEGLDLHILESGELED